METSTGLGRVRCVGPLCRNAYPPLSHHGAYRISICCCYMHCFLFSGLLMLSDVCHKSPYNGQRDHITANEQVDSSLFSVAYEPSSMLLSLMQDRSNILWMGSDALWREGDHLTNIPITSLQIAYKHAYCMIYYVGSHSTCIDFSLFKIPI